MWTDLEPTAHFYERFEITNRLDSLTPRYNIAPGQMVPVVIAQSPNRVVLMRWGLIPWGVLTFGLGGFV
jgi:putative SOS response-associated peptidase YedK